ncbi:MAG: lipoyl(octanoyl) transferase LipB [Paludibacteraceae bacterium]
MQSDNNLTSENLKSQTANLKLLDWGVIEYNEAWKKQEEIFNDTISKKQANQPTENYLILCEHPHVYTLGKSGDESNLLLNYLQLQARNATFVHTNRGGDITYHGPGQVVGYPILDLENLKIGLRQYIYNVEEAIIQTLEMYGITGKRLQGASGVWLDMEKSNCRKICAIGVRSSKFVTMHGFALNANTQLEYFNYINPCGFVDKGVTSISKELGVEIDVEVLKKNLFVILTKIF